MQTFVAPNRLPLALTALAAVTVTAAMIPFAHQQLGPSVSFVPALVAVILVIDLMSVYLLLGDFQDRGNVRILLMAGAYAWSLVVMTGYALAFPGAVSADPPLALTPSMAPYFYITWHGGFPLLLGAAWAPWPRRWTTPTAQVRRAGALLAVVGGATMAGLATVAAVVAFAHDLPVLISGLDTSRMTTLTAPLVIPLVVLSLAASVQGTWRCTGPERWASVAVLVCLCDLTLSYTAGSRFSVGWYGGRSLTIFAAAVVLVAMQASFRSIKAQAERDAVIDALTGLQNRRGAYAALDVMVALPRRSRPTVGVVTFDLDWFKHVNDRYGHEAGDEVLAAVGQVLLSFSRAVDLVARTGGEEFLVLLPGTDHKGAAAAADRLRLLISDIRVAGVEEPVTASLGVTVLTTGDLDTAAVLRRADAALFQAKRAGRNRVHSSQWAPTVEVGAGPAPDRSRSTRELRQAIRERQFFVLYQPIVDLRTGHATSFEALVRWQHPARGLVLPDEFIPLAEQTGLINDLTDLIVAEVGLHSRTVAPGSSALPCAVNISAQSLSDPVQSEHLVAALTALAGRVTIEVTESVMADSDAVSALRRLAGAGVPCAVDDFGTGYSSLASLKVLPATTLKIDRRLVQDIERDPRDAEIVRAVVALARALHLQVVAEGVETLEAALLLREAGVDRAQGYLFARPLSSSDLAAWQAAPGPLWPDAPAVTEPDHRPEQDLETVLDSVRSLLRVDATEQAVGVLMRTVTELGGRTVPVERTTATALPIDIGLGTDEPLLPEAPFGSQARASLQALLPELVEDARVAADKASRMAVLCDEVQTDALTGLANRRALALGSPITPDDCVAIVHLDHFARFSDAHGQAAADRLLVAFSRTLRRHLRATDAAFHLDGREFLVVLRSTGFGEARAALDDLAVRWKTERPYEIAFSAGLTVATGDLDRTLLAADEALYPPRRLGRVHVRAEAPTGSER